MVLLTAWTHATDLSVERSRGRWGRRRGGHSPGRPARPHLLATPVAAPRLSIDGAATTAGALAAAAGRAAATAAAARALAPPLAAPLAAPVAAAAHVAVHGPLWAPPAHGELLHRAGRDRGTATLNLIQCLETSQERGYKVAAYKNRTLQNYSASSTILFHAIHKMRRQVI